MRLRTWLPGVVFLACGTAAAVSLNRLAERMDRAERLLEGMIQMQARAYFTIDGRVYYQQPGETREAWTERVKRVVSGQELMVEYLCDMLHRCDVPGGTVEVCTPCNSSPPSPQCIANHEADVAAACAAFNCDC